MTDAPLLVANDLRVDVDGTVAIEGASFETRGASVAIVGDGFGLLSAIAGNAAVRAGTLAVVGLDVARREQLGPTTLGVAPLDPPLPPKWTAREYLVWGARLAGMSHASARESATSTLAELGLEGLGSTKTAALSPAERRAVVVAQAAVARPALLVAAGPLSGLS